MRATYTLTASNPRQTVDLNFMAAAVVVNNPTGSPIFVRIGAADFPTANNADLIVPAAQSQSYPLSGRSFALVIGDPTLLSGSASANSGLFESCIVTFIDASEFIPAYGSASYLSLSTSDLSGGAISYSGVTSTPTYDLGPWGGAMLFVSPGIGSGQAVVQVLVSADGTTFYQFGVWALWPGNPAMLLIPRTLRYVAFVFNTTGIPGEPAISGVYNVRGTLAEVFQSQFTPIGNGIARAVTVPHLGTITNIFVTANLPSVGLRWQGISGNPLGEAIWWTGPTAAGPWSVVAFREQIMGGAGASLYRSIGNLDLFLRVDILDIDVTAGGLSGTLTMSVAEQADLTSYEQLIFAALGDVQSGVPNVNQSIYHELDSLRLTSINMDSRLNTLVAALNNNTISIYTTPIIATAFVWQNVGGFLTPGNYISSVQLSWQIGAPFSTGFSIQLAYGTGASMTAGFFAQGGMQPEGFGPQYVFDGPKRGGILIPASQTNLWVISTTVATLVNINLTMRSP